ncbi:MAG: hypothetical protein KatS3mg076_0607 [Candidatus Binatia bacterium]|nr:MAG: hypothetical protein KatS3mg076_0607 [Candidatus Binatia bacterium]
MRFSKWTLLWVFSLLPFVWAVAPPPVVQELGWYEPTPKPTAEPVPRIRLISTITVRNSPDGDTMVVFEATDFADEGEERYRTIVTGQYALGSKTEEHPELRDRVLASVRELERALLAYVEAAGPPKEREPLFAP